VYTILSEAETIVFGDERIHTISRLWRDNLPRLQRGN